MQYKRFDDRIVARFDKGDEVMENLKKIAATEDIKLAQITAIGATDDFTVGIFDTQKKAYREINYTGDHEITSIVGTISTLNGELFPHMHITCSDLDGNIVGGHMLITIISLTCEMVINIIDGEVDRERNDDLGINVFKFEDECH